MGDWFTSRTSVCALFPIAYASLENNHAQLRELFGNLCRDDTPMVRRAASGKLGEFAAAINSAESGKSVIKAEMIPLFKALAQDDQDSVRLQTIGAAVQIAQQLEKDDIDAEVIIGHCRENLYLLIFS